MSTELSTTAIDAATMEVVIASGDLARLSPQQRLAYYYARCEAAGLDPRTQPFSYIVDKKGKMTLYALKGATEQLSAKYGIHLEVVDQRTEEQVRIITVRGRTADGRQTDEIGAVSIKGAEGEELANAMMRAITKAKRRCILSLCGLGMNDETEVGSIPGARTITVNAATGEIIEPGAPKSLGAPPAAAPLKFRDAKWDAYLDDLAKVVEATADRRALKAVLDGCPADMPDEYRPAFKMMIEGHDRVLREAAKKGA